MNENVIAALFHLHLAEEPLTTTDVAKGVFEPDGTPELRNADRKVRHYFEESYPHLVESDDREGTQVYTLCEDRVYFGMGQMHVVTDGDEEIVKGLGDVIVYETEEGEFEVVSISYEEGGVGETAA